MASGTFHTGLCTKQNARVSKSLFFILVWAMGASYLLGGFIQKDWKKGFSNAPSFLRYESFPVAYSLEGFTFHLNHTLNFDYFCFRGRFNV